MQAVFHYEGTVARLLADDKGTRFKIAFGMPTLVHDDDGVRVVRAALRIRENLSRTRRGGGGSIADAASAASAAAAATAAEAGDEAKSVDDDHAGQRCAIGIATGLVFCGEAGSRQRCEYTAVGNKVIIAARLMQVRGVRASTS